MKKEDADQLIRCMKDCWWRLTVFFAVELLFVTLVVYGWPHGDWGFGWGAVGAVGTLVTGVGAIYIAYVQKKWIQDERDVDILIIENRLIPALVILFLYEGYEKSFLNQRNYKNVNGINFIKLFYFGIYEKLDAIEEVYQDERSRRLKSEVVQAMSDILTIKRSVKIAYDMNKSSVFIDPYLDRFLEKTDAMGKIFFDALSVLLHEYDYEIRDCLKPGLNSRDE